MSFRPLPKWNYTKGIPAFYDSESSTALEQTHKVYNKMNELVEEYNEFAEGVNSKIEEFIENQNQDYEEFKVGLRQEFQDFIDTIDLKVSDLEKMIDENGFDDLQTLTNEVNTIKATLNNALKDIQSLNASLEQLEARVEVIESDIEELKTNDKKLTLSYDEENEELNIMEV